MSIHAMNFYVMKMNEPEPYSTCLNVGEFQKDSVENKTSCRLILFIYCLKTSRLIVYIIEGGKGMG